MSTGGDGMGKGSSAGHRQGCECPVGVERGLGTLRSLCSLSQPSPLNTDIRALFSTVSPLSSHEVDGVRKEKERLTDGRKSS